jgi:hypothetical protein
MPGFKSEAQRKKWKQLVNEGRVSQDQYDAREEESPASLPERASPRKRTVGPSRAPDASKINDTRY